MHVQRKKQEIPALERGNGAWRDEVALDVLELWMDD